MLVGSLASTVPLPPGARAEAEAATRTAPEDPEALADTTEQV
jgi:hypothetical protein